MLMKTRLIVLVTLSLLVCVGTTPGFAGMAAADEVREYRILATNKTSTMEK